MFLERITDCVPRFVAQQAATKIKNNKVFVVFEGVSDCNNLSVIIFGAAGIDRFQPFQSTVSVQAIHDNGIVNKTSIKIGRSLVASEDLCQSACSSSRKFTHDQNDLEIWP